MQVKDPGQIRRWRKQRHYSQRDLAYLVRKSQATIWQIESGRLRNVSEDLAISIAARLDVPWEELFIAHEHEVVPIVTSGADSKQQRTA
ncbi:helix-turn-helix transcriptional regulator [Nocardia wallacei]|uniref:helix-turn-helix transcriptional regulator n=1 Tax=Nocardia wallacei TaxID=480035 RepID=UPI002458FF6C|nr:helix-turn-helix transcriptional regulator [Nocardia wallacei]